MLQLMTSLFQTERPLRSYSTIEPGIAPLVATMNRTGLMRTIASCEGHWYRGLDPYVAFEASMQIGSEFDRLLHEDTIAQLSQLFYHWRLEPYFNEDHDIRFRLSSPQLSSLYIWRPTRLRHDFETLASMIQKLGFQFKNRTIHHIEYACGADRSTPLRHV
ncbi:MAG: hypothetical protein GDA65_20420 [Nitrospira sp. CR1.1]|jgi:hypothetical protein|nr:hypothetical protein [Nitrospira sp. CR1.1]MBA5872105.1 hypothetical protein [Nitrospira sp. CR2.1]